jgi:uncharacterized membrane protein YgcG
VIKIGDANKTLTGEHRYALHYQVARAVNIFDQQPEIYWNATGDEWRFPINEATAQFILPAGVDGMKINAKSFRGPQGSTAAGSIAHKSDKLEFSASHLGPGEGLTFVLRLPPGTVDLGRYHEMIWWLMDWWPAIFTPWLTLLIVLTNWWVNGRDPENAYIAGVDWNPPKELSPAEVGTLIDESCDVADIVSTLVDLAARGYLKIKQTKVGGFLYSANNYEFTRVDPPPADAELKGYERAFLEALFSMGSPARLSDLKYHFFAYLPHIKQNIYDRLTDNNYFVQDPEKCRQFYNSLGVVFMLIGLGFILVRPALGIGLALSGVTIAMASPAMPARTKKGVDACRQAIGFKRFVQKAEKERIRVLAKDDPTVFGRLLPYAMVLGAADQWADKFHDLLQQPPEWFEPYGYGQPNYMFSSTTFVNDLGDGMRSCATSFTAVPHASGGGSGFSSDSSWSSSSGAGGGFSGIDFGSSGGGFGGGGGSSW